jgi:ketosteroid isomerase-like protein
MSQENVEIVRRVSEAFNRGDIEGCLAFYGEDIEIEDLMNAPDVPRVVRGLDGARELLRAWIDGFEVFRQEIVELIDLGDQVVGVSDYYGTSREGLTIHLRVADVVEIRDGKLVRATFGYETRETALQAVGLSEQAMSQENLEIARRANAALQGIDLAPLVRASLAGDMSTIPPELVEAQAALLGRYDPSVEIDTSGLDMPGFGVLHGLEGLRDLWRGWIEEWEHYSFTVSDYSHIGEHVLYDVEIHAIGKSSGADVMWHHCQALTFRDGKIIRWSFFKDRAGACRAVEAAGPTE